MSPEEHFRRPSSDVRVRGSFRVRALSGATATRTQWALGGTLVGVAAYHALTSRRKRTSPAHRSVSNLRMTGTTAHHPAARAKIAPVVVDMTRDEAEIKALIIGALQKAPPIFAATKYGFEDKFLHLVRALREKHALHQHSTDERCVSISLADLEDGLTEEELQMDLRALTSRICEIVLGGEFARRLETEQLEMGGALSMRFYPRRSADLAATEAENLLGAHVDGNFITLLWSDAPGLQVPGPEAPLDSYLSAGIPSIGVSGATDMDDRDWVDVEGPPGCLLVTIGQGWFQSAAAQLLGGVPCATYHRVSIDGAMPAGTNSGKSHL